VDFLISCPCGHTLEQHEFNAGCKRCACRRNRVGALDAAIATVRRESSSSDLSGLFLQLESETIEAENEALSV